MSEERSEKKAEIEFQFEYDPDYRIVASNGIWGGVTPRGDFRLDFFVESLAIPEKIKNEIINDKLGREISRTSSKGVVSRRIQVGVLLPLKEVESIANFLLQQLKNFREITEDKQ